MSAIAQAAEFNDIRLKAGEKSLYKHINKDVGIKFPIQVDIALPAHKVSLLLQAELGGMDFPASEQLSKHKSQFQQDKAMVFQHVSRLIRCVTDCQLARGDSVAARHALELARSFAARVWDSSPLQLKQLEQVGNVAVRKLANAGINSIEALENTEAHRIETVIGRGPPFGMKLLSKLAQFPKLRVLVKMAGKEMKPQKCIKIRVKAEIGFLNENVPAFFRKKLIYVCFLAETSDGQLIDFRRIAASKLHNSHEVFMTTELTKPSQYILCHVMCDEIAGTCRSAELRPNFPASFFPISMEQTEGDKTDGAGKDGLNSRQYPGAGGKRQRSEDFNDSGLDDGDLLAAENVEIMDIDAFEDELASLPSKDSNQPVKKLANSKKQRMDDNDCEHPQLKNGKWACNHKCKDKAKCKHLCCKEGLDKPPKPPKKSTSLTAEDHSSISSMLDLVNNNSSEHSSSRSTSTQVGPKQSSYNDGTQKRRHPTPSAKKVENLAKLHKMTTPNLPTHRPSTALTNLKVSKVHEHPYIGAGGEPSIEDMNDRPLDPDWANAIGPEDFEDFAPPGGPLEKEHALNRFGGTSKNTSGNNTLFELDSDDLNFEEDENDASLLEASMVGLDDSLQLKNDSDCRQNRNQLTSSNASFSSGTVHESSSSRAERPPVDDFFDGNDGIYDFMQEDLDALDTLSSCPPGAGQEQHVFDPSNYNEPVTSPCKKLFFTSPERAKAAPTDAFTEEAKSQKEHDSHDSTPIVRIHDPHGGISNTTAGKPTSDEAGQQARTRNVNDDNIVFLGRKSSEEEQKQKLLDQGIDPSFYDEFKDYVEFI